MADGSETEDEGARRRGRGPTMASFVDGQLASCVQSDLVHGIH